MILEDRIIAFEKLGAIIVDPKSKFLSNDIVFKAETNNYWFVEYSIRFSIFSLSRMLSSGNLRPWISSHNFIQSNKNIGVIIPSNIPFVGFYDFLSIILSGNNFVGQLSYSNNILLPHLAKFLLNINSQFSEYISFEKEIKSKDIDMLIATGDDNSAAYFNYKYADIPKLIRKHRNSIGVLNGCEALIDLEKLSSDVYMYFGLGCRSVSKIFVPRNFDFHIVKKAFKNNKFFCVNNNYMQVYSYQKTMLQMHNIHFIDFDNLLLVESDQINAPVSVLFYQFYDNMNEVLDYVNIYKNKIQCIVSNDARIRDSVNFGNSQLPMLNDFPDGVDVLDFLSIN